MEKQVLAIEEVKVIFSRSEQINRPSLSLETVTDLCMEQYLKLFTEIQHFLEKKPYWVILIFLRFRVVGDQGSALIYSHH